MACSRFGLKRLVAYATRSVAVSPFRPTNPRAFATSSSDFSPYLLGGTARTRQSAQQNSFTKIDRLKMAAKEYLMTAKEYLMNSEDLNLIMWFTAYHNPATIKYLLGVAVVRFILLTTLDKVPTSHEALLDSLLHLLYQHQKRYTWKTDKAGTHFFMNVNGHEKQDVSVFYCNDTLFISDKGLSPTRKILQEVIKMPLCVFDPKKVTGDVTEGGELIVSFPFGNKKELKPLCFEVRLV